MTVSISITKDANGCMLPPRVTAEELRQCRKTLGWSQERFALEFDIPLGTLRDWEQKGRQSRASSLILEKVRNYILTRKSNEAATTKALESAHLG